MWCDLALLKLDIPQFCLLDLLTAIVCYKLSEMSTSRELIYGIICQISISVNWGQKCDFLVVSEC